MSDEPSTPPLTEAPRPESGGGEGSIDVAPGDDDPFPDPDPTASLAERVRAADGLLVLSDFDGTLADIRPHPDEARIRPAARDALASLAGRPGTAVAVVSGRALADVRERVGLDGVAYAGNHGLEIEAPGRSFVHPAAEGAASTVAAVCADLRDRLRDVEGTIVEEKDLSATVHYRQVRDAAVDRVRGAVGEAVDEHVGGPTSAAGDDGGGDGGADLRIEDGKEIVELKPAVDWDKGRAVEWLRDVLVPEGETWHVVYVGDDVTDEDAFRALAGDGTTVRVGSPDEPTEADFLVDGPDAVPALLEWFAAVREN